MRRVPERWREPFASSETVRQRMSAQRSRDTVPELAVRRALYKMGLRYRVHIQPLPSLRRKADVVFTKARVAVFVDGCFWHGCPEHGGRRHDINGWYWPEKIERNRRRDADTDRRLADNGWTSVRAWEHDDPDEVAAAVRAALQADRLADEHVEQAAVPGVTNRTVARRERGDT
ncbi:MAG: very short patch repair endonuclease [Acidimicrobiales bacterium]